VLSFLNLRLMSQQPERVNRSQYSGETNDRQASHSLSAKKPIGY
jgi:hypothetical protein